MKQSNMYNSLLLSVLVQFVTGIFEIGALFIQTPPKFLLLKQMMVLEVIVQFIEGSFYVYWLTHYTSIANITPMRYYDWVLTTPTMLINLICYLKFLQNTEKDFFGIMHDEFYTILIVLILNWLMLLFGYLGERFILPISASVLLGFIPFLLYYYIIYSNYVTEIGLPIFIYFFVFWSLYGVAASLPYNAKNTCYNMLDLVAKNFFGIFLFYMIIMNKS